MKSMNADARRALSIIRRCVAKGRYVVLANFVQRMDQRAYFWADVLSAIDLPDDVRSDGVDRWGRPKWIIRGGAEPKLPEPVELVCALDRDDDGNVTVFITIY
jgi:hypothetical protein